MARGKRVKIPVIGQKLLWLLAMVFFAWGGFAILILSTTSYAKFGYVTSEVMKSAEDVQQRQYHDLNFQYISAWKRSFENSIERMRLEILDMPFDLFDNEEVLIKDQLVQKMSKISNDERIKRGVVQDKIAVEQGKSLISQMKKWEVQLTNAKDGFLQNILLLATIVVLVAAVMLGGVFIFWLIHNVIHPLDEICEGMDALGNGITPDDIKNVTDDEIGDLARLFNNLKGNLKKNTVSRKILNKWFENMPVSLIRLNSMGEMIALNEKARKMFAGPVEEYIGNTLGKFFEEDISFMIDQEEIGGGRKNLITARGEIVPVNLAIRALDSDEKEYICVLEDLSAYKKNEDERIRLLQKIEAHVQETPLAYIEWSKELEVLDWNRAAEDLFGYKKSEAIGRSVKNLIVSKDLYDYIDNLKKTLSSTRSNYRAENKNITKDGKKIFCEWYNAPLVDKEGIVTSIASFAKDITKQKISRDASLLKTNLWNAMSNCVEQFFLSDYWQEHADEILGLLGNAVKADYALILKNFKDGKGRFCAHTVGYWERQGPSGVDWLPVPDIIYPDGEDFLISKALRKNESTIGDIQNLPKAEQVFLHQFANKSGRDFKSYMIAPLYTDNKWWGVLAFTSDKVMEPWHALEVEIIQSVAGIFSAAIGRK